jgi:hypothetical protein
MRLSPIAAIAAATLAAHAATLDRYGFYRDELYFLACAKHLRWGFADQPPLAPLLAAAALPFDGNIFAVRMVCAAAAAFTVLAADALARDFGARTGARVMCALAVALMPASLFLGNTLTTTSLEPLTWTLAILFGLRFARSGMGAWWIALLGVTAGAAYMKYSIFLLLAAATVAALAIRDRRLALGMAAAGGGAFVLLLPNVLWQYAHGFPFLGVLAGDVAGRHAFNAGPQYEYAGVLANAPAFVVEQFAFTNPVAAILWIPALLRSRFFAIAYAALFFVGILSAAKGYYIIGIYPALFAAGASALQTYSAKLRLSALAAVTASGLLLAPLTLPVLPVDSLVAYMHAAGAPRHLMQPLFADEFGWRQLTAAVARQYDALPAATRASTPIFADTYGGASAIAYYGPFYALPQPIGAQNQYYLWGTRGYRLRTMLAVGASEYPELETLYRSVRMVGTFSDPHRWVLEGPTPIYLCTNPRYPDAVIWRRLRWYGA